VSEQRRSSVFFHSEAIRRTVFQVVMPERSNPSSYRIKERRRERQGPVTERVCQPFVVGQIAVA